MIVYTIGFTQKSARRFFELLDESGVRRLLDIRLNPYGQLSGFSKKDDLAYFLERLSAIDYLHLPELAPTDSILHDYLKDKDWGAYVARFETLMDERKKLERELADAKRLPSSLKATLVTPFVCPFNVIITWPFVASHTFAVQSWLPDTNCFPSALNATHLTGAVCP